MTLGAIAFFLFFSIIYKSSVAEENCVVNLLTDVHQPAPLLIDLASHGSPQYVYPSKSDEPIKEIPAGDTIGFFCPGKPNELHTAVTEPRGALVKGVSVPTPEVKPIKCLAGTSFTVLDSSLAAEGMDLADFTCQLEHLSFDPIQRPIEPEAACGRGKKYEIGYDLGRSFLQTIDLCHDVQDSKTYWAHHVLRPNKERRNPDFLQKAKFKTGVLFEGIDFAAKNPFLPKNVAESFPSNFNGDPEILKNLPFPAEEVGLRGSQLIPSLDKFHLSEKETAYYFANVVPVWRQLKEETGNWHWVQEFVRQLSSKSQSELDVWSGGLGTLHLLDTKIYLTEGKKIPVPKHLYNCVVDKNQKQALCLVVENNPYLAEGEVKPVCDCLNCDKDVFPNLKKLDQGYGYLCSLKDFYEKNKEHLGLEDIEPYLDYEQINYEA